MGVRATMDGNTAVATIAYKLNEVCAIFPITPSSSMAELADEWAAERQPNLWGNEVLPIFVVTTLGTPTVLHQTDPACR